MSAHDDMKPWERIGENLSIIAAVLIAGYLFLKLTFGG